MSAEVVSIEPFLNRNARLTPTQERLFHDHLKLAKGAGRRIATWLRLEVEDTQQDACLILMDAAREFDASKGVPFSAFASALIRRRLLDHVRRHRGRRYQRLALVTPISLAEVTHDNGELFDGLDHLHVQPVTPSLWSSRLQRAMAELRPQQKLVLEMAFFREMSQVEIAESLGLGASRISQIYRLALEQLRLSMNGGGDEPEAVERVA